MTETFQIEGKLHPFYRLEITLFSNMGAIYLKLIENR